MSITLDKAEIAAFVVESMLYGIFCMTFLATCYIWVAQKACTRINYPMLLAASTMWLLATLHVSISFQRILDAFLNHRDDTGGPAVYFADLSHWTHILKTAVYVALTCVGDGLAVYRAHVVCRNYVVTLGLSLMVAASAISGSGLVYVLTVRRTGDIFSERFLPWITSFNLITAITTAFATASISLRLWWVNRQIASLGGRHSCGPFIPILIESGAVYTTSLIIMTILYMANSNAVSIVLDAVTPIIGIVFSMIIIRVALRLSFNLMIPSTWKWTVSTRVVDQRLMELDETDKDPNNYDSQYQGDLESAGRVDEHIVMDISLGDGRQPRRTIR